MKTVASILIASHNRLSLFRRTLWGIANRPPAVPFEVVVVDDGSTEDVLGELKLYSAAFPWKFVRFDATAFEQATGLKKFYNNPAVTNNIAFQHSAGQLIFQQGNEIIPVGNVYDQMIADAPPIELAPAYLVMSTTFDVPPEYLNQLDSYGTNLTEGMVRRLERWPLQSRAYRSDVTNYISLAPRSLWDAIEGYDERYYGGIACEDSDFVRRARKLPDFRMVISNGISLHQFHSGKTLYYNPPPAVISLDEWNRGVAVNRSIYHAWDESSKNPQGWPWGQIGVGEVVTNS